MKTHYLVKYTDLLLEKCWECTCRSYDKIERIKTDHNCREAFDGIINDLNLSEYDIVSYFLVGVKKDHQ